MMHRARICGVLAMVLAGCGTGNGNGDASDQAAAAADSQMPAMPGMPGMAGGADASLVDRMMASMDTALQRSDGVAADSLAALLPAHRQAVANLIAEMNAEMRGMSMTGDAAWTATIDSLRQDLVAFPELGRDALARAMTTHRGRVVRLMEMHRSMMRGMRM